MSRDDLTKKAAAMFMLEDDIAELTDSELHEKLVELYNTLELCMYGDHSNKGTKNPLVCFHIAWFIAAHSGRETESVSISSRNHSRALHAFGCFLKPAHLPRRSVCVLRCLSINC